MYILERACRIQILAQSGGVELHRVAELIIDLTAKQMSAVTVGQGADWPGLASCASWTGSIQPIATDSSVIKIKRVKARVRGPGR